MLIGGGIPKFIDPKCTAQHVVSAAYDGARALNRGTNGVLTGYNGFRSKLCGPLAQERVSSQCDLPVRAVCETDLATELHIYTCALQRPSQTLYDDISLPRIYLNIKAFSIQMQGLVRLSSKGICQMLYVHLILSI
jgi:hypothetical protein